MEVHEATPADLPAVATVLDAAMLQTGDLRAAIENDEVLVVAENGRILGAIVLVASSSGPEWVQEREPAAHVDAVAVRRRRRGQGIGSALVEAAVEREGSVTAAFDPDVRPFYESLGFDVETVDGRCRGVFDPDRQR